jgi:ribosomal protein S27AE
MSRNLGGRGCDNCNYSALKRCSPYHFITKEEAGYYFKEFEGMVVSKRVCMTCGALYLAWHSDMKWSGNIHYEKDHVRLSGFLGNSIELEILDLSFYNSFNDEPSEDDLPQGSLNGRYSSYVEMWEERSKKKETPQTQETVVP